MANCVAMVHCGVHCAGCDTLHTHKAHTPDGLCAAVLYALQPGTIHTAQDSRACAASTPLAIATIQDQSAALSKVGEL